MHTFISRHASKIIGVLKGFEGIGGTSFGFGLAAAKVSSRGRADVQEQHFVNRASAVSLRLLYSQRVVPIEIDASWQWVAVTRLMRCGW